MSKDDDKYLENLEENLPDEAGQPQFSDSNMLENITHNFLEKEMVRLKAVDSFFSHKLPTANRHPQTELLLDKYSNDLALLEQELLSRLAKKDSFLWHNLSDLWDFSFK